MTPFVLKKDRVLDTFTAGQARTEDAAEITALLQEIARWLRSKGSTQWSALLEGKDAHGTTDAIERGEVFVFRADTEIAAIVILMKQPSAWDERLWGERAHAADGALYLHRLAIRRKYAKLGLGAAILNWCRTGVQADGKHLIRLDTLATSAPLNALYSSNGYTLVSTQDNYSLYEISLG